MEETILACYDEIAAASSAMLACAREGDWDGLVESEAKVAAIVARLQSLGDWPRMSADAQKRKMQILRKVLAEDSEIRSLTQSWLNTLETFLTGRNAQRKVVQAYR